MRYYVGAYVNFEQYHLSDTMAMKWGKWILNNISKNISKLLGIKKEVKQYLPFCYTMSF